MHIHSPPPPLLSTHVLASLPSEDISSHAHVSQPPPIVYARLFRPLPLPPSLFSFPHSEAMMRKTSLYAFAATRKALVGNGPTFHTAGDNNNTSDIQNAFPMNERGIRSSSPFPEPNTAIYDTYMPWTYFQPIDVNIHKMPEPEAKYYQFHTKKPWDVSTTDLIEIQSRKKYVQGVGYFLMVIYVYFLMPKEKSYSGETGSDGFFVMLPKNQPEKF
ncbi:hypothetical protein Q4I32_004614 [Leishmania shawi]|uniref:Uncharacterized protein n=2 Tax=Leishmania guyanensis species complex TaxID=38579 RepID=A0AAW3BQ20_9TRYP